MIQPLFGGKKHVIKPAMVVGRFRVPLPKEYLAAAVDYVRFHSLMLDFKAQLWFLQGSFREAF